MVAVVGVGVLVGELAGIEADEVVYAPAAGVSGGGFDEVGLGELGEGGTVWASKASWRLTGWVKV
jgi:hypothetical protein